MAWPGSPSGVAHFVHLNETAALVPVGLTWHVAWAYFTGLYLVAAGAWPSSRVCIHVLNALSGVVCICATRTDRCHNAIEPAHW